MIENNNNKMIFFFFFWVKFHNECIFYRKKENKIKEQRLYLGDKEAAQGK